MVVASAVYLFLRPSLPTLQFILQQKLGRLPPDAVFNDDEKVVAKETTSVDENDSIATNDPVSPRSSLDGEGSKDIVQRSSHPPTSRRISKSRHMRHSNSSLRSFSKSVSIDKGVVLDRRLSSTREGESDDDSMVSVRHEWALDQIAMSDDSDSEFFDARGK